MERRTGQISRRMLLASCAGGFGLLAFGALTARRRLDDTRVADVIRRVGPAKNVIFLFMSGGPSQMDTFDPKPLLAREHGKPIGIDVPQTNFNIGDTILKSPFRFKRYGESGADVSELFPELATCVDEMTIIRSMVTDHSEHAAASLFLHTGSGIQGRPSMGSWINYGLGSECDDLPGYVVLESGGVPFGGMPCFDSGFLPPKYRASVFRQPPNLLPHITPYDRSSDIQRDKLNVINALNRKAIDRLGESDEIEAAIENHELAFRMQNTVPELADLSDETKATHALYGLNEPKTEVFGRSCLLARRLVERGVRFVQLLSPRLPDCVDWDQHENLEDGHRRNARAVDRPIAGLLKDLRARGLLDETIVLWGGEFGRTPMAQIDPREGIGRDHNPSGFTMWMAGGGVRRGLVYGQTDEYGLRAIENRVHMHDLHATLLHLLGIDHTQLTYPHAGREFRLTDVFGHVVEDILA